MTFKTRVRQVWENPLHPVWIILAILELAAVIACFNRFVLHNPALSGVFASRSPSVLEFFHQDVNRLLWGSYIVAGGIRLGEAIAAFSGKSISGIWGSGHLLLVVSMVLSYVVGPVVLLWGLKARKKWLIEKPATPSKLSILIALALGGYSVFWALVLPVEASVESWTIWQRMKSDSYTNAVRDGAIASVSELGFQAQQKRLLPEAKGSGPWMDGPGGITLADIDTVLPRMERGLWAQGVKGSMKYFLEVHSPDSLTIWGIADVQGNFAGSTFRNKDGTTGNVQVRAGVTPDRVTTGVEN